MSGGRGLAPILAIFLLASTASVVAAAGADGPPAERREGAVTAPPAPDETETPPEPGVPADAGDAGSTAGGGETGGAIPGATVPAARSGMPSLEELTATRDRPLFSPDRRPPPGPPEADAPTTPEMAEPAEFRPVLVGVVAGPGVGIAMVKKATGDGVVRVRVDEAYEGWTLSEVDERSATFVRGEERVVTTLARARAPVVTETPDDGEGGTPSAPP